MTETILQKLEERMMTLLMQMDEMRKELNRVKQENAALKAEHSNHSQKLQGIISLLDAFETSIHTTVHDSLQRSEEFGTA